MAWSELTAARTKRTKTYQDTVDPAKRQLYAGIGALHHGEINDPIDATPVRVNNAALDGWRVTAADWHYAIGQPGNKQTDGWIGFGGKAGAHWLQFRLLRVGYMHWPTRSWQDVGGAPAYVRTRLTSQVEPISLPDGSSLPASSLATWGRIWSTPGGGDLDINWRVRGAGLKEFITINQAGRAWITANAPPVTPAAETFFGFVFEIDHSDVPKWVKNGIEQSIAGDFDDDDDIPIEIRDATDELLGLMPIDFAWIDGVPDTEIRLHKRIYTDAGTTYLLVGARVTELSAMPAGTLVFDPTIDVDVTASGDDGNARTGNSSVEITGNTFTAGYHTSASFLYRFPWQRFTGISGLSGATINSATLSIDRTVGGTILQKIHVARADAPAAPTTYAEFNAFTRSTASAPAHAPIADPFVPDVTTLIQELADNHDPSTILFLWADDSQSTGTTENASFLAYDNGGVSSLSIDYTAGGGGGGNIIYPRRMDGLGTYFRGMDS